MKLFDYLWKSLFMGVLCLLAIMFAGIIIGHFGLKFPEVKGNLDFLTMMLFFSGFFYAIIGRTVVQNLRLSKYKIFIALFVLFFLNSVTQILEALFFAPGLITWEVVPAMIGQQVILCLFISIALTLLFKSNVKTGSHLQTSIGWKGYIGRILLGSGSYVLFYYVFGSVNAFFFTGDYYESQVYGLHIPDNHVILIIEACRSLLLVLSILPMVLNLQLPLKKRMVIVGMTLFILGGLIPMLLQLNALPTTLVIASAIEMFFQFFLTGVFVTYIFTYTFQNKCHQTDENRLINDRY